MLGLPVDVWAMMIFSVLAFFGVSLWMLFYTLRQEERKMDILTSEDAIDTHSPTALRELRAWIEQHPHDPDVADAEDTYRNCVQALQSTERHFYTWTDGEINSIDRL